MTKRLYVGNLSYGVTESQLRELFSQAGEIESVSVITDKYTGEAKGFAFVEMTTEAASSEAINRFNGYSLGDRDIAVNEARPRTERPGGGPSRY
jgi:RNA recognition motif-containing protein